MTWGQDSSVNIVDKLVDNPKAEAVLGAGSRVLFFSAYPERH